MKILSIIFILLWLLFTTLFAQADMIDGYAPRNLTRGKMWSTYRNNGMDGGGNRGESNSHSQESLTYPGNMSRVGPDFVEYFLDIEAYINTVSYTHLTLPTKA